MIQEQQWDQVVEDSGQGGAFGAGSVSHGL